jgi:hypothetical protein
MPLRSPEKVDKILEYTAAAANVLEDVATASEIPFLSRVCTITLAVIPMVQVCNWYIFVSFYFIVNAEYRVSTGKMPSSC